LIEALFKEQPIYEQSATRTQREQQDVNRRPTFGRRFTTRSISVASSAFAFEHHRSPVPIDQTPGIAPLDQSEPVATCRSVRSFGDVDGTVDDRRMVLLHGRHRAINEKNSRAI
jgi:hypothetical protein